ARRPSPRRSIAARVARSEVAAPAGGDALKHWLSPRRALTQAERGPLTVGARSAPEERGGTLEAERPPETRGAGDDGAATAIDRPLCVDLDGTLALQDTLHEVIWKAMLRAPLATLGALGAGLWSRAAMKARLARLAAPAPTLIAYRRDLLEALWAERAKGRRVVLATGAHQSIADAVSAELGLFDEAIGTKDGVNLTGPRKAAALVARFGEKGFDYVGDSRADLKVWPHAARAWVAGDALSDRRVERAGAPVARRFSNEGPLMRLRAWMKAARLYQWVKNGLVFVPALSAGVAGEPQILLACLIAFFCFSFCASGVYMINDLVDLDADRRHPRKRLRPFASGALSATAGVAAATALLAAGLSGALLAGPELLAVLLIYIVATFLYSFLLKRVAMFDVFVLGGLYSLRLVAGGAAADITLSVWLLGFAAFFFLSLACLKRVNELGGEEVAAKSGGRAYAPGDRVLLTGFGLAVGVASSIVFVLYITSERAAVSFASPGFLWGIGPLLMLWLARLWLDAWRGAVRDDPIVTVLRDPASWLLFGVGLLLIAAAHHGSGIGWEHLNLGI
ncbi:MAG: UbiA family prenyltransferase, partial [Pseudomonadota bacterium]